MATNDWELIRSIFDDALRRPAEERPDFVREACGDDEALRIELESLLKSLDSAELFLETPAVIHVAENSLDVGHRLSPGDTLLHYEIVDLIGSGGMGEVYAARDSRLDRRVAVKLLCESFLPNDQAARRLFREARAAAKLEHPNICQIYEIAEAAGHHFIVMQYVSGRTLADILSEKPIGVRHSLDIAIQIAEGLSEAHARSIIHRDIKPANIIISEKGHAKILDFGLAKFIESDPGGETSRDLNSVGAVMGTVPFMSPEQLRGIRVDSRTDIFSLGALLYEMVSGRSAFHRDSNAETIAAILNDEPEWSAVPAAMRDVLARCLAKNVDDRYQTMTELLKALKEGPLGEVRNETPTPHTGDAYGPATDENIPKKRPSYFWQSSGDAIESSNVDEPSGHTSWSRPLLAAGAVGVVAVILIGYYLSADKNVDLSISTLTPTRLASWKTGGASNPSDFRVSNGGKMIAYSSSQDGGVEAIYIKQTSDGAEVRVTDGTWSSVSPLWSPDDQELAFLSIRDDQPGIYKMAAFGGPTIPLLIGTAPDIALRRWSRDGSSIYYEQSGGLFRLDLLTGKAHEVDLGLASTQRNNRFYDLSADETKVVYCDTTDGQRDLWVIGLAGGEPVRVTNDAAEEFRPKWHPGGDRILYNVLRNDFPQINLISSTPGGVPREITRGDGYYSLIDISADGEKIFYWSGSSQSNIHSVSVDSGVENEVAAEAEFELWPEASPDGKAIVYHVDPGPIPMRRLSESALVIKLIDGSTRRLSARGFDARWMPDSRNLAVFRLSSTGRNRFDLWKIDTVTGAETMLVAQNVLAPSYSMMPAARMDAGVLDFTRDGSRAAIIRQSPSNIDVLQVEGGVATRITENADSSMRFYSPKFSPDDSAVAAVSMQSDPKDTANERWRLHYFKGSESREILNSERRQIRLLGWISAREILIASVHGVIRPEPGAVDLHVVSVDGSSRKVIRLDGVYPASLKLSVDGSVVAYARRSEERDEIWVMSTRSDPSPRRVFLNPMTRQFLTNLTFSPDNKTIFYDKQEATNTISVLQKLN